MINMFENATVKLTLMYMGILTVICFLFSYNWYTIATDELNRALDRQLTSLNTRPIFRGEDRQEVVEEISQEATERYEEGIRAVRNRIVATNISNDGFYYSPLPDSEEGPVVVT